MTADSRSVSSCRNLAKSSGDPPITSAPCLAMRARTDRKSTRLNSSHLVISYAVFCLKKKKQQKTLGSSRSHTSTTPAPEQHSEEQLLWPSIRYQVCRISRSLKPTRSLPDHDHIF